MIEPGMLHLKQKVIVVQQRGQGIIHGCRCFYQQPHLGLGSKGRPPWHTSQACVQALQQCGPLCELQVL